MLRTVGLFLPRPSIGQRTTASAITSSTKIFRQILYGNLLQKLIPIGPAKDIDLLDRHLIQPRLDDRPNSTERPRGIDDVELAHRFGISVLAYGSGLHDIILDAIKVAEGDASEVEDGAESLDWVA